MKKEKSFRSPLGTARGLGAAKAGTHHWWMQRVTAVAIAILFFYLAGCFFQYVVFGGYEQARNWLRSPLTATAVVLFLAAGFHHAAAGLQVIIEDYIHCECLKTIKIIGTKFLAAAFAVLGILCIAKILFGA